MAEYRQIHTHIWKDSWFLELSAQDKLLFIYLFSNERACLAGIYDLSPKIIAFETDMNRQAVDGALRRFEAADKIRREGNLIWIPNLMRYNASNVTSPKIQTHLRSTIAALPDCQLKAQWIDHYNGMVAEQYRMDTVLIPYPEPEPEQEQEPDPEQESESDSDFLEIRQLYIGLFPDKPRPREGNKTLASKARARMKKAQFRESWQAALTRAARSDFCQNNGWFNLGWFLKNDENYEKCLDGNYDNRGTRAPPDDNKWQEAWEHLICEMKSKPRGSRLDIPDRTRAAIKLMGMTVNSLRDTREGDNTMPRFRDAYGSVT